MKVVIVEDEQLTAERIRTLLHQIDPEVEVMATIDTVKTAVQWFSRHENPDLVLMDIQLADGLSFDIFDLVRIESPVIFITAYQEYAIRAFKVNSVDYLLKPIKREDLESGLKKYQDYFAGSTPFPAIGHDLMQQIRQVISNPYKTRFMVKVGDRIKTVEVKEILYLFSLQKGTYLHTSGNRNYTIDFTLDRLGDMLDPERFFRINRKYIVCYEAISDLITLSGSKLKVNLVHSDDSEIYISRERLSAFKAWLDR